MSDVQVRRPSFFIDIPEAGVERIVRNLERRRFPEGSVVVAPGERMDGIYVVDSGAAEVFAADRDGVEHHIGFVHPGETVGEMALLVGPHGNHSGGATVRATTDVEVLVMRKREFDHAAARFPQLYRNLGTILSERLARTDVLAAHDRPGRLLLLRDVGAPPLLGFALASSLAWHAHAPTILLVLGDDRPPELEELAPEERPRYVADLCEERAAERAIIVFAADLEDLTPETIRDDVEELFHHFEYVLVQVRGEAPHFETARPLQLAGDPAAATDGGLTVAGWHAPPSRIGADAEGVVRIPEPSVDERARLRTGLLPLGGAAANALGWVSRDLAGLKVGVACGAGSIRGFAHAGVLDVLEREGVPVDYVAGTSVGSIVASCYSIGMRPAEIIDALAQGPVFRLAFPTKSLLSIRKLEAYVHAIGGGRRFEETNIPLAVIAADLVSHKEVVFRRGEIASAVVASISIPGIYPTQPIGSFQLVDGGVLNPVPATAVADMGAGRVIAVKLGAPPSEREEEAEAAMPAGTRPAVLHVMLRAIELMQSRIDVETHAPTVRITPEFGQIPTKLRNFQEGRRFVEIGQEAAEEALPRLGAALPWVGARLRSSA